MAFPTRQVRVVMMNAWNTDISRVFNSLQYIVESNDLQKIETNKKFQRQQFLKVLFGISWNGNCSAGSSVPLYKSYKIAGSVRYYNQYGSQFAPPLVF